MLSDGFYDYLFLTERERQSMSGGGAEREGDRIGSRLQPELSAQSPTQGSNSQTARS